MKNKSFDLQQEKLSQSFIKELAKLGIAVQTELDLQIYVKYFLFERDALLREINYLSKLLMSGNDDMEQGEENDS